MTGPQVTIGDLASTPPCWQSSPPGPPALRTAACMQNTLAPCIPAHLKLDLCSGVGSPPPPPAPPTAPAAALRLSAEGRRWLALGNDMGLDPPEQSSELQ